MSGKKFRKKSVKELEKTSGEMSGKTGEKCREKSGGKSL